MESDLIFPLQLHKENIYTFIYVYGCIYVDIHYPYVYIYVCEWIIEIGWVHLNAHVMSGEKVDRRNSEREILVGRNV